MKNNYFQVNDLVKYSEPTNESEIQRRFIVVEVLQANDVKPLTLVVRDANDNSRLASTNSFAAIHYTKAI